MDKILQMMIDRRDRLIAAIVILDGADWRYEDIESPAASAEKAEPPTPVTHRHRSAKKATPVKRASGMSAAQRAETSRRMKAFWAKRRAAAKRKAEK